MRNILTLSQKARAMSGNAAFASGHDKNVSRNRAQPGEADHADAR